jgi:hypothetical protein
MKLINTWPVGISTNPPNKNELGRCTNRLDFCGSTSDYYFPEGSKFEVLDATSEYWMLVLAPDGKEYKIYHSRGGACFDVLS